MNTQNNSEASLPQAGSPKKNFFTKKKIIISVIVAFFAVISIAGVSFAKKVHDFKQHLRDDGPLMMMLGKMTEDLNLTESQKSDVEKIRQEIKTRFESNKDKRQDDAGTFESLFRQDNLDKQALETLRKKHDADREEMKGFMEDELIKFHKILTSDQRNKVADKMKDMREKFKNGDFPPFHDRKDDKDKNKD